MFAEKKNHWDWLRNSDLGKRFPCLQQKNPLRLMEESRTLWKRISKFGAKKKTSEVDRGIQILEKISMFRTKKKAPSWIEEFRRSWENISMFGGEKPLRWIEEWIEILERFSSFGVKRKGLHWGIQNIPISVVLFWCLDNKKLWSSALIQLHL